jgi:predicted RNA-binding Zn ribbon-like protein
MTPNGGRTPSSAIVARTCRSSTARRALGPTQVTSTVRSGAGSSSIERATARSWTTRLAAETVASAQAASAIPAPASANAPGRAETLRRPSARGTTKGRILNTGKVFLQVSKAPRYDLPKAAPEPLRLVQLFVNTVDLENEREWLADPRALEDWARERRLVSAGTRFSKSDLERALELREAFRVLLRVGPDAQALATVEDAAREARLTVELSGGSPRLAPQTAGIDGLRGRLVAVAFLAMLDGSWERLKTCRNCRWAFFDESKNRSARWCSMALCGNRLKTRAYRRRHRHH